jgi:hypothetical protein
LSCRPGAKGRATRRTRGTFPGGRYRREEYLKRERRRPEQVGVSAANIDRFIDGDFDELPNLRPKSVPFEERLNFVLPFLEALRVSRGATELDYEEAGEIGAAREKLCWREVLRKYGKIVDKWEQLDALPFMTRSLRRRQNVPLRFLQVGRCPER